MLSEIDLAYFAEREQAARLLAEQAEDPAARRAHLEMAAAYRRRQLPDNEIRVKRRPQSA